MNALKFFAYAGTFIKNHIWFILLYSLVLIPLSVLLYYAVESSFRWRTSHDTPILMYGAFLVDRLGFVPYRDIFDMNFPGSYFSYVLVGRLFGYTDSALRWADLTCLVTIIFFTVLIMRGFGVHAAWFSSVLFALLYLKFGPAMTLQREYVMLVPLSGATAVAFAFPRKWARLKFFLVGLLVGYAASIKPHSAIAWPILMSYLALENWDAEAVLRERLVRVGGLLLVSISAVLTLVAISVGYLFYHGALDDFLGIALNYVPLYGSLDGRHHTIEGRDRLLYLLNEYSKLGYNYVWCGPALLGLFAVASNSRMSDGLKRKAYHLAALAMAFSVYPVFSGQFWEYHWLIFLYFLCLCTAFCFLGTSLAAPLFLRALPVGLILVSLVNFIQIGDPIHPYSKHENKRPKAGRVDAIATYLKNNLQEGEEVQPLDWTGAGAIHAMLITETRIATRFIYHFHFYHHVSTPYIKGLRKEFVEALRETRPALIIEGKIHQPYVRGKDTTRTFPAMTQFIHRNYDVVLRKRGFVIWRLKGTGLATARPSA